MGSSCCSVLSSISCNVNVTVPLNPISKAESEHKNSSASLFVWNLHASCAVGQMGCLSPIFCAISDENHFLR